MISIVVQCIEIELLTSIIVLMYRDCIAYANNSCAMQWN